MQYRCRPRLTLLALLACASAAAPPAAVAQNEPAPSAPVGGLFAGLGLSLRRAPVVTSGAVSYDLRVSDAPGEGKSVAHLVTGSLNADTYVYQPWFATLTGTLRFTSGRSGEAAVQGLEPGVAELAAQVSRDRFVTGEARLELFPRSRFPSDFRLERSDSRIDGGSLSALSFRSQSIGYSQRYRPASNAYTVSGSFGRRDQWSAGARDNQHTLTADFSTKWKQHDLSLGGAWNQARRRATDERSEFRTLLARHNYAPVGGELSLNTTVNWSQALEDMLVSSTEQMALQWSTVGLWRRGESPLTLTGSVRALVLRSDQGGAGAVNTLAATLGATYELNKNTRLAGSANVSTMSGDAARATAFAGAANVNWQGDAIEFRGLRYDRFASASASATASSSSSALARHADAELAARQTQAGLSGQLGHGLARTVTIAESSLVVSGAQTLSAAAESSNPSQVGTRERSSILQHTINATWDVSGDGRRAFTRASYVDSTELGGGRARFQLFNFQLSGNFNIDRHQGLTGDLTWQRVQQRLGEPVTGQPSGQERLDSTNIGGEISYRHQRLFGNPRLRFTSRLKLAQDVLNQPGVLVTIPDRETKLWENRVEWSVGRLDSQLVLRLSEVEGKRRELLMWRIQRSFGN